MSRDPVRFATIPRSINHVATGARTDDGRRGRWRGPLRTRSLCDQRYVWEARPGDPITCPVCIERYEMAAEHLDCRRCGGLGWQLERGKVRPCPGDLRALAGGRS